MTTAGDMCPLIIELDGAYKLVSMLLEKQQGRKECGRGKVHRPNKRAAQNNEHSQAVLNVVSAYCFCIENLQGADSCTPL